MPLPLVNIVNDKLADTPPIEYLAMSLHVPEESSMRQKRFVVAMSAWSLRAWKLFKDFF